MSLRKGVNLPSFPSSIYLLPGLIAGVPRQISRQIICLKSFDVHFDQADKRAAKIRPFPAASIDDHPDGGHIPSVRPHNLHGLLHAAAAGDHIFGHDEPFVGPDLESPSQDEPSRFFLRENVPFPQGAPHFLADDNSAQGGRDHRVAVDLAQFVREPRANIRRDPGVLEEQGALKKLPAMQARPQHEMPIEERARLAEKRKQIVAHPGSARASRAGEGAPAFANVAPTLRRGRRNEHARARALPGYRSCARKVRGFNMPIL